MPVHGRRPVRPSQDETVMRVGADAMIDDAPEQAKNEKRHESMPSGRDAKYKARLEALEAERDSYLDMARRERADFDNYRKRIERDMASMKRESLANFLKEFFRPLDDMDRVLVESQKNHSFESLIQGVRIMEENFWRAFAKAGVKRIDANGKQFDPNLHEAMAAVPTDEVPPNTIIEVYENGYKLDDYVLRPARVVVSKAING
jgi:Molecular chaperone GrpE (heat shock protein)